MDITLHLKPYRTIRLITFLLCFLGLSLLLAASTLSAKTPDNLTQEEYDWLAQHPVVRMGIDPGYGPYSFVDDTGRSQGISLDFLALISEQLGIRFEIVSHLAWKDLIEAIKAKEIDAIATVSYLPERESFLNFSKYYLNTPLVVMTRNTTNQIIGLDELEQLQIAMVRGYSSSQKLLSQFPSLSPHYVLSPKDGLNAVALGLADAYVGVLGVNQFVAQHHGISGLKVNAAFDMEGHGQAFGVRKDWPILANILTKALDAIPEKEQTTSFEKWLPVKAENVLIMQERSLISILFPLAIAFGLLCLLAYLFVLGWNKQLKTKLDEKVELLSKKNEQIDELNAYLNAMVKASTDIIFIKDTQGIYKQANNALSYLLDKPLLSIIGKNDKDLFPEEAALKIRRDELEIMDSRKVKTYEEPFIRADGEAIPFLTTKGPIIVNDELLGIFCIAHDISEFKLAMNLLQKARDDLEEQVHQRTAELRESNSKLQIANRDLAAANKELETFTYSVSHDLKAPLRGIDGYSRLLMEDHAHALNEEGLLFLHNLRESAESMRQLIDDLLAYSRIERHHIQVQKVQLKSLIERVQQEFKNELEKVTLNITVANIELSTDPLALTLIIRNLVGNAIKFSRNTLHPEISISAMKYAEQILITVQDNGIGFDMQFHDRIFEIFQRLQRTEDYPGTGIGLAIAFKAAQRMGGSLRAESKPGKGATFYLEFPYHD